MNVENTIKYLEELLPGFNITVEESYKGKPNNRFKFEKDGVDAAMLFAQKLNITKEFLQDVATAVNKRFNSPKALEKAAKKSIPEEKQSPLGKTYSVTMPSQVDGKPTELELSFYEAAKKVVHDFEEKYPMT